MFKKFSLAGLLVLFMFAFSTSFAQVVQVEAGKFAYTVPNISWDTDYGTLTKDHESYGSTPNSYAARVVKPYGNWELGLGVRHVKGTAKARASVELQENIEAMHAEADAEGTTTERKAELIAELDKISNAHQRSVDDLGLSMQAMYYTKGSWQVGGGAEVFATNDEVDIVPKIGVRKTVGKNSYGFELMSKGHYTGASFVANF